MTNFDVKKQKGPSTLLDRQPGYKSNFLGRNSANPIPRTGGRPSAGPKLPLPSIDHGKQMDKLRSITGRSDEFTDIKSDSKGSIQFSKPKIGVKNRMSNSLSM